jgi:hypothetical protein
MNIVAANYNAFFQEEDGTAAAALSDNSPALQRWVSAHIKPTKSRQGRKNGSAVPAGTFSVPSIR